MIKVIKFFVIIIVFPVWGVPSTHFNSLSLEIIRIAQDLSQLVQRYEFKRDFARDAQGNIIDTSQYIYTTPDGNIAKFLMPYQLFALAAKLEVVNRYFKLRPSLNKDENILDPVRIRAYKNLSYMPNESDPHLQSLFENTQIRNFVISKIMKITSTLKIQIVSQETYSILLGPDHGIKEASRNIIDLFQEFLHLVFVRFSNNREMIDEILRELSLYNDQNLDEIDFQNLFIMTEILKEYFSDYLSPKECLSFYDKAVNHCIFPDHFSFEITTDVPKERKLSNLLQFLFNDEFKFP